MAEVMPAAGPPVLTGDAAGDPLMPLEKLDEPCLQLEKLERHLRDEAFQHETEDREDHTFNGVMVDLTCRDDLPCEYLEVRSVWVRGELGPLTVYAAGGPHMEVFDKPDEWAAHHKSTREPSFGQLVELKLEPPLRITAGQTVGLYVHSSLDGDQAIVYDNHRGRRGLYAPEGAAQPGGEPALRISPGLAHLSPVPFGGRAPWGSVPWRRSREFVGRVGYGVRWLCWSPAAHARFPAPFQETVRTLLLCGGRQESNLYHLREEMIFFILNRCGWDWFGRGEMEAGAGEGEDGEPAADRYGRCPGYRTGPEAFHMLLNNFGHQLAMPPPWFGPAVNMGD